MARSTFFWFFFALIALGGTSYADDEIKLKTNVGYNAFEWGLSLNRYFMKEDPEERNPYLKERYEQEKDEKKVKKPSPTRTHWSFNAQTVSLTSPATTDWVTSLRVGLGVRASRAVDTEIRVMGESAPSVSLSSGALEFKVSWFLKLPRSEEDIKEAQLKAQERKEKMKYERVQSVQEEEIDPEATYIGRYRPPRLDLHFTVGVNRHVKDPAGALRPASRTVNQTRLTWDADFKWSKRWLTDFSVTHYLYPDPLGNSILNQAFNEYALGGPLLPGRFAKSAVLQGFPDWEFGVATSYLKTSKMSYGLDLWLAMYQTSVGQVMWGRPWLKQDLGGDWDLMYSLDLGVSGAVPIILGGVVLSRGI